MGRKRLTASTAALALVVAVGAAYATIPDSQGVINACYDKQSGHARIVDDELGTPKGCGNGENALAWNQAGQQGSQGPPGAPGEKGDQGDAGPTGAPGPAGADGVSGYQVVRRDESVPAGQSRTFVAACPSSKKVLGGGLHIASNVESFGSEPTATNNGWSVTALHRAFPDDPPARVTIYAICALTT